MRRRRCRRRRRSSSTHRSTSCAWCRRFQARSPKVQEIEEKVIKRTLQSIKLLGYASSD